MSDETKTLAPGEMLTYRLAFEIGACVGTVYAFLNDRASTKEEALAATSRMFELTHELVRRIDRLERM